jgi:hypothetical protein
LSQLPHPLRIRCFTLILTQFASFYCIMISRYENPRRCQNMKYRSKYDPLQLCTDRIKKSIPDTFFPIFFVLQVQDRDCACHLGLIRNRPIPVEETKPSRKPIHSARLSYPIPLGDKRYFIIPSSASKFT